jgi:hypothetical protein
MPGQYIFWRISFSVHAFIHCSDETNFISM